MSDEYPGFVDYLQRFVDNDNRRALAELRRSLTFAPGAAPRAFPYVEPFIACDKYPGSAYRLAFYLVAGLFALHPRQQDVTVAKAMGALCRKQEQSPSIEGRFIALLESDGATLAEPLRHCVTLLKAHDMAIDYRALLKDLVIWLNPSRPDELDQLRCRWARDFYRTATTTADSKD